MTNQNDSDSPDGLAEEEEKKPNIFERIETHIQSRTLRGFVALIPLLVTVSIARVPDWKGGRLHSVTAHS